MPSIMRFALPAAFAAVMIAPFAAQAAEYPRTISERQAIQQQRILNGVSNGRISPQEYQNLERRSHAIDRQETRFLENGNLTRNERYRLNQRLDRLSNAIDRDRRN